MNSLKDRVDDLIVLLNFALKIELKANRLESMIDAKANEKALSGDQVKLNFIWNFQLN
jgi:hypothetical protein